MGSKMNIKQKLAIHIYISYMSLCKYLCVCMCVCVCVCVCVDGNYPGRREDK